MLGEIAWIGFFPLLVAAPAAPPPSEPAGATANCSASAEAPGPVEATGPAEVPSPEEVNRLRAERLVGEFLAPLAERKPDAATASRLPGLVVQLGSDEWPVREAAGRALVRCGMAAAGALQGAARHRDPEVSFRARQALSDIPDEALARIRQGLDVYLGRSAPSRERRIVSELAAIPDAAVPEVAKRQQTECSAVEGAERSAAEAEKAGDLLGGELGRLSGRVAKSRACALDALLEHLNREIADLRAAAEAARVEAESKAKAKAEAARAAAVAAAAPAPR